jgi:hypothetical protein
MRIECARYLSIEIDTKDYMWHMDAMKELKEMDCSFFIDFRGKIIMTIKRELLESCLDEMQYHEVPCSELVIKIKELLAQPEQENLTPRQGLEEYKKGYYQAELDLKRTSLELEIADCCGSEDYREGFKDGALYAEKAHGIGVDDE